MFRPDLFFFSVLRIFFKRGGGGGLGKKGRTFKDVESS